MTTNAKVGGTFIYLLIGVGLAKIEQLKPEFV